MTRLLYLLACFISLINLITLLTGLFHLLICFTDFTCLIYWLDLLALMTLFTFCFIYFIFIINIIYKFTYFFMIDINISLCAHCAVWLSLQSLISISVSISCIDRINYCEICPDQLQPFTEMVRKKYFKEEDLSIFVHMIMMPLLMYMGCWTVWERLSGETLFL